jgi:hypothetical protein
VPAVAATEPGGRSSAAHAYTTARTARPPRPWRATCAARGVGQAPKGGSELAEPLCIVFSAGAACAPGDRAVTNGVMSFGGRTIEGLVPDDVARVSADFGRMGIRSAEVHDNAFRIADASTTTRTLPGAPPATLEGKLHGRLPPTTMTAPFKVRWIDAQGRTIGPPTHP